MGRKKCKDILVKERFDEAKYRDEFAGDSICVLHGLEKAMIGTAEVPRIRKKNPTYRELIAWLKRYNLLEKCKTQYTLDTGKDRLTVDFIKAWAQQDLVRKFLYTKEFTEKLTRTVAVYERGLCIKCLADQFDDKSTAELHKDECTKEQLADPDMLYQLKLRDATEWFEYNTVRSLPYAKEAEPIILAGFEIDDDRWEAFKH